MKSEQERARRAGAALAEYHVGGGFLRALAVIAWNGVALHASRIWKRLPWA